MAIVPFAEKKLLPVGTSDPVINPIGFILHVDAGNSADLYEYFRDRSGGIESHFHVRKDGHLYQYRDTNREADANYKANSFYVAGRRRGYLSVETQGTEHGGWTPEQIATIKRLLLWGKKKHGIPLQRCASSTGSGTGYHTMWGAPSAWTPVSKSCPGPDRIKQFNNVLVPWFKTSPDKVEKEFVVDDKTAKQIDAIVRKAVKEEVDALLDAPVNKSPAPKGEEAFEGMSIRNLLKRVARRTGAAKAEESK